MHGSLRLDVRAWMCMHVHLCTDIRAWISTEIHGDLGSMGSKRWQWIPMDVHGYQGGTMVSQRSMDIQGYQCSLGSQVVRSTDIRLPWDPRERGPWKS